MSRNANNQEQRAPHPGEVAALWMEHKGGVRVRYQIGGWGRIAIVIGVVLDRLDWRYARSGSEHTRVRKLAYC